MCLPPTAALRLLWVIFFLEKGRFRTEPGEKIFISKILRKFIRDKFILTHMASLKQILSITLPITIILIIVGITSNWPSSIGGLLLFLGIVQGIFWKFVKWNF